MSAEAVGWVFRHSSATGSTLAVHLAVADVVNDQHGNQFFMRMGELATKARCGRATAQRAMAWLEERGMVELLTDRSGGRGRPACYVFLFPDLPVVFDSRKRAKIAHFPDADSARSASVTARSERESARSATAKVPTDRARIEPNEEPKGTQPEPNLGAGSAAPSSGPTGDPRSRAAHALAVLAFEQPVKPTIAGDESKRFVAVLGLFDRALKAGRSVQELTRAIEAGIDVWTTQGLNTTLARTRNGRTRDGSLGGLGHLKFDDDGNLVR